MMAVAVVLSLLIGVSLGLLGGGGSILTVPTLVYALGVESKPAIAASLVIVGVTSAVGAAQHAWAGRVRWKVGLIFGVAGMVGAALGGYGAGWFEGRTLLLAFAGLMVVTAVAMFRGRKQIEGTGQLQSPLKIVLDGLVVGGVTGLVGAGGGFLVVPALVLLGGLPMAEAVGTSLLVIAMKSFAGFAGHAAHVEIDWGLTGLVSVMAVIGSLVGGRLAQRIDPERLRKGFAVFVLVMAAFQIAQEL